ncbi:MAG: RluA family pseudouridine synthase [Alphaproteobacteria bacterium]|nr:RluA family pseudouridine synthase [Alphaproteobacteria bacterium]
MLQENNIFFISVQAGEEGIRLDKFLTEHLDLSRAQIQRLIQDGCVMIDDDALCDASYKIKIGENINVRIPEPQEADPVPEDIALDIVYEDEDLIVVNKPAGMVVHEGAGVNRGTLVNALLYHCADSLSGIGGVKRPGIVHRIDKETSGLLVAAKNDAAHIGLSAQFEKHSIERTYYAFVYGLPNPLEGTITGNIARSKYDRKKMALVQTGGKEAVTHYKTLEAYQKFAALVECRLETGRTHQIRVHLSSKGHHLIGDKVYRATDRANIQIPAIIRSDIKNFGRQALHAKTLGFIHPKTGEKLFFDSILPPDLQQLHQKLRQVSVVEHQ